MATEHDTTSDSASDAIWAQWRALIRARRDGQVSEAEYRRTTADLRRRLDAASPAPAEPAPAGPVREPAVPTSSGAPFGQPPTWTAAATETPAEEPGLLGLSGVVTLVVIVAVLAAAVGFALVSLAA